jgi:hypothetical protein
MDRRIARFWKWLKHRLELDTVERREKERRQDNRIRVRRRTGGGKSKYRCAHESGRHSPA